MPMIHQHYLKFGQEMKAHSLRTIVISCLPIPAIVLYGLRTSPIQFVQLIWNPVILYYSISPFHYLTCSFSWAATQCCTWTAHMHLTCFLFLSFSFYIIFALVWKQIVFIKISLFLPNVSLCLTFYFLILYFSSCFASY